MSASRFWAKVNIGEAHECWLWTGGKSGGYGRFRSDGAVVYAHRMAYELVKGEIPEGLSILHSCDEPACCNPMHLRAGDAVDNARDREVRGRGWQGKVTHCPAGHEYTEANTIKRGDGRRACKACNRARCRRDHAAKRDLLVR